MVGAKVGGRLTRSMRGYIRGEVIDFYRPDVMVLVETWLKGD